MRRANTGVWLFEAVLKADPFKAKTARSLRSRISVEALLRRITTREGGYWFKTGRYMSGLKQRKSRTIDL